MKMYVLTSINNENVFRIILKLKVVLTSINNENVFEDYIKVESCINIH